MGNYNYELDKVIEGLFYGTEETKKKYNNILKVVEVICKGASDRQLQMLKEYYDSQEDILSLADRINIDLALKKMHQKNEEFRLKLDNVLQGLVGGDPKIVAEYSDPMRVVELALSGDISAEQIQRLKDAYFESDHPAMKNIDQVELRYQMSQIPGYYGHYLMEDNQELADLMYKGNYPRKMIESASKSGLSEEQKGMLFDILFNDDREPDFTCSVSEDFSSWASFPSLMMQLSTAPGVKPHELLDIIWSHPSFDNQLKTAELMADSYPEIIKYMEKNLLELEKQTQEAKKELDQTREGANAVYARYKYEGLIEILENYKNNFQNLNKKLSKNNATPDESTPV